MCNNCNKFYIGQTGRNFSIRYREHTRQSENNPSTFYQHLKSEKHTTDNLEQAIEILHVTPKGQLMNILEEIEIYLHSIHYPSDILNEQVELQHKKYIENFIHIIHQENG